MVRTCYVCKRPYEKETTRSYHLFPRAKCSEVLGVEPGSDTASESGIKSREFPSHPVLRAQWFQALGLEYVNTKNIHLCSDHFTKESFYIQPNGRRVLKKGATPTNFSVDSQATDLSSEESTSSSTADDSSSSSARLETVLEARDPLEITGPCQNVDESNLDTNSLYAVPLSSSSSTISAAESIKEEEGLITETCAAASSTIHNGATSFLSPDILQPSMQQSDQKKVTSFSSPNSLQRNVPQCDRKMKRYYRQPRYMGDIVDGEEPLSPEIAERNWAVARKTIGVQKKKIRKLQQQNRRLKAKVASLQALMKYLKEKNVSESEEITIIVNQE